MRTVSMRNAVAAACSLLIAFIGACHVVVGTTLYPEGPALFGGLAAWYAAGLVLVLAGGTLFSAALGLLHAPVRSIAAVPLLAGIAIALLALTRGRFHLFATTLAIAAAVVALLYQAPARKERR